MFIFNILAQIDVFMRSWIFFIALFGILYTASGQENHLIQLSGIVRNEYEQPLKFVHIKILNKRQGTITDRDGLFSFIAQPYDTIQFSSVGYKRAIFVLPDSLPNKHLDIDVYLARDTIMIEEAVIYPWKTYDEFKEAFLALELPDDDYERARKNIAIMKTQIILADDATPSENFRYVMQEQYEKTMVQGMRYPVIKLFDPFAWGRFIEAIKRGDFKKND